MANVSVAKSICKQKNMFNFFLHFNRRRVNSEGTLLAFLISELSDVPSIPGYCPFSANSSTFEQLGWPRKKGGFFPRGWVCRRPVKYPPLQGIKGDFKPVSAVREVKSRHTLLSRNGGFLSLQIPNRPVIGTFVYYTLSKKPNILKTTWSGKQQNNSVLS